MVSLVKWSKTNQAVMHVLNKLSHYSVLTTRQIIRTEEASRIRGLQEMSSWMYNQDSQTNSEHFVHCSLIPTNR